MDYATVNLIAYIVAILFYGTIAFLVLLHLTFVYLDRLTAKGNVEGAYRFANGLLRFFNATGISRIRPVVILGTNLRLSRLAEKRGDLDEAVEYAKRSITRERNPTVRSMILKQIAVLLRQQNRDNEAEQYENEALSAATQNAKQRKSTRYFIPLATEIQQAALLSDQGHFAQSIAIINERLPSANPISVIFLQRQRATALAFQGKYDQAIASRDDLQALFEPLKKIKPVQYGYTLTSSYLLNPKHVADLFVMETLLVIGLRLHMGQVGAATEQWESLLGKKSSDQVYPFYTAVHAWIAAAHGNDQTARSLVEETEAKYTQFPWSHPLKMVCGYTIARTYAALRDYTNAVRILTEMAEKITSPTQRAMYRTIMADCYMKMERTDLALELYKQVVAAGLEEAAMTEHARTQLRLLSNHSAVDQMVQLAR